MKTVSDYYNALDVLLSKYVKLSEFSESEIVPYETKDTFYPGNSRMMKPKFIAYMRRMQDWLRLFREVQKMAEESQARLQRVAHSPAKEEGLRETGELVCREVTPSFFSVVRWSRGTGGDDTGCVKRSILKVVRPRYETS